MSIVQDAVKKAASGVSGYKGSDYKKSGRSKYLLFFIIGGVSLMLIVLVIMKSSGVPAAMSLKDVSITEAIYKPMSAVTAKPDSVKKARRSSPDLILSGIMQLVDGPRAIINGVMVGIGDVIGGAKIVRIEKDAVTLKDKDKELILGME